MFGRLIYGSPANFSSYLGTTIPTGVNGETLDISYGSCGDTDTANVGTYQIHGSLSNGSGSLSNYSVTLVNGTLTVNPYAVTYDIDNDTQTYGNAANLASDLGATIPTGVNGETLDISYGSCGDTDTSNVGTYQIHGSLSNGSGSLSNYTVTLVNGTLTVNPYAFTYDVGNDSQTYGSPANFSSDLGTTIPTGVNGETLDISYCSCGDTATANVGTYQIHGNLSNGSGTLSNYSVTLVNGTLTVNQASTTTVLTFSANPVASGASVTMTATVSSSNGTPTGTVSFYDGGTLLGTGTVSSGVATFSTSSLSTGTHTITATYSGDTNFSTSTTNGQLAVGGSIAGTVENDSAGDSMSGVAVNLLDGLGDFIASTTTDASGNYEFAGLAAGSYEVKFVPPGGTFNTGVNPSTEITSVLSLSVNQNMTGVNAGYSSGDGGSGGSGGGGDSGGSGGSGG